MMEEDLYSDSYYVPGTACQPNAEADDGGAESIMEKYHQEGLKQAVQSETIRYAVKGAIKN
jgi:hypothetical protein